MRYNIHICENCNTISNATYQISFKSKKLHDAMGARVPIETPAISINAVTLRLLLGYSAIVDNSITYYKPISDGYSYEIIKDMLTKNEKFISLIIENEKIKKDKVVTKSRVYNQLRGGYLYDVCVKCLTPSTKDIVQSDDRPFDVELEKEINSLFEKYFSVPFTPSGYNKSVQDMLYNSEKCVSSFIVNLTMSYLKTYFLTDKLDDTLAFTAKRIETLFDNRVLSFNLKDVATEELAQIKRLLL